MNAAQVRAKARMAMKRREEEIAQEEIEGGELNLVPYLDIVTNIMLFLLATVTSGQVVGTINSTLPEYANPDDPGVTQKPTDPKAEPSIQLVVALTKPEIIVFSLSGQEGTLENPRLKLKASVPGKEYDYVKLTETVTKIVVDRKWDQLRLLTTDTPDGQPVCVGADKTALPMTSCRPLGATDVFLIVDEEIPYQTVISVMDAIRENRTQLVDNRPLKLFPGVIFSSGVARGAE
jgi:biopolymer transport protein ExbD